LAFNNKKIVLLSLRKMFGGVVFIRVFY